jgi:hypothetical protein
VDLLQYTRADPLCQKLLLKTGPGIGIQVASSIKMMLAFKSAVKSLFLRLGYEIRPYQPQPEDNDVLAARSVKESEYYSQWVAPCPLFIPGFV